MDILRLIVSIVILLNVIGELFVHRDLTEKTLLWLILFWVIQ